MIFVLGLLMGVVAGLRAMTPAAALSWAAYLGILKVSGTWLSFLGSIWAVAIFTVLALGELTSISCRPRRAARFPWQFSTRVVIGAIAGVVIAGPANWIFGALVGIVGAVIGTLGGASMRGKLAASFGRDRPAALIEDAVAIIGAALLVLALK